MNTSEQQQTIKNLAVILEMSGQSMSTEAMVMIADELSQFDYNAVQNAMRKCARECKYKITLAEIIDRIDDGRPSPEKAWQEVQHLTEDDAKVLTTEQNQAFCMVSTSLIDGDTSARITAKQTFMQEYKRLCQESRDQGKPVQYFLARANGDYEGTKALAAVNLAMIENKLPQVEAVKLLPEYRDEILNVPQLEDFSDAQESIKQLASGFSLAKAIE